MAKILLIDYIGHSDSNGNPLGHTIKTIKQYGEILSRDNSIDVAISETHNKFLNSDCFKDRILFSEDYKLVSNSNIVSRREIKRRKLGKILELNGYDLLFFMNVDFELGMFINRMQEKSKIIVISYMERYCFGNIIGRTIKNVLLERVFKYSDKIIVSSKKRCLKCKHEYIPDYFYYPEVYGKYNGKEKKQEYICLGTISDEKDIELVFNTFAGKSQKLKIVGKFYNEELYRKLKGHETENIVIENRILDYEEYYSLMSEYKYIILPYKEEFYKGRSSGVLLECIFLGSIPIAPKFLLEQNEVNGLGYENGKQLESIVMMDKEDVELKNEIKIYNYEANCLNIRELVKRTINM